MKTAPVLFASLVLALTVAACAEPDESDRAPDSTDVHADAACSLTEVTTTADWTAKNTAADLWPACATTANVIVHEAPDKNGSPAFFAFVVWNDNTVGRAYWIVKGDSGVDFRGTWNVAFANRISDHSGGLGGSPEGGNPTGPGHPHIDGSAIDLYPDFLTVLHNESAGITNLYSFGNSWDVGDRTTPAPTE